MPELLEWFGTNYPLRFKKDPIPGWRKQVARLRSKGNPHTALENYVASMEHTAQIREAFYESAAAAEAEIDRLVDMRRGKWLCHFWVPIRKLTGHQAGKAAPCDAGRGFLTSACCRCRLWR